MGIEPEVWDCVECGAHNERPSFLAKWFCKNCRADLGMQITDRCFDGIMERRNEMRQEPEAF